MILSRQQLDIVEAPLDEKTIVMAAPASGKTRVAIERLNYILKKGVDPKGIVLLTFTNNAGAEMVSRIDQEEREGLFVGTIHSYANLLLSAHGIDTSKYRDEEEFDELFNLIYENPHVLREIDYLIIDESQDLNEEQFNFLEHLNPKGSIFLGDIRQSIYSFKGATPKRLLHMMQEDGVVVRELTQNYRNAKKILAYSNFILNKMKRIPPTNIIGKIEAQGKVAFISQFDIIPTLMTDRDWGKWAILCRYNKKKDAILNMLRRNNIPAITFRQAQGSLDDLYKNMNQEAVKVLTIHACKGLEFPKVIVTDLFTKGEENIRLNYVSVTRAQEELYLVNK